MALLVTFNDVTELKLVQLELDKKNEILLRINADLDNFVHTASHDLLSPLSTIEASINVMNEIEITDPTARKFIKVINSSVRKFSTLIKDISLVSKLESGMIEKEMVDIDDIINNIEWSLETTIKSAGAEIHRDLAVKHIHFSKKNLRSILFNLVSNAIKFKGAEHPVINIIKPAST